MKLSVICPFYNEEKIISYCVSNLIDALDKLKLTYELIVVNDGSTDKSLILVTKNFKNNSKIKILSYNRNMGRGYALKYGIQHANGKIIITTEIDLSWGNNIFLDFLNKFETDESVEMIIASPHLKQGGYKNVPWKRQILSKLGNKILKFACNSHLTMYTGMTRAYKNDIIKYLPLDNNGKEFHLEVIQKAVSFGLKIKEIPAFINWIPNGKNNFKKRKSSSNLQNILVSHIFFALIVSPKRYIIYINIFLFCNFVIFAALAIYNFLINSPSAFFLIVSLIFLVINLIIFLFGIISSQNSKIERNIWYLRRDLMERAQKKKI